jgi:hypothetical protein
MMDLFKPRSVAIVGHLRTRINQIVHAWGVEQGMAYRKRLHAQLVEASAKGASIDDLHEILDTLEAAGAPRQ